MLRIVQIFALPLLLFTSQGLTAQRLDPSPPAGERLLERLDRIFNETSPPLGARLPNLSLYDAGGNKFRLRNLKGQHTVLVFGCLT